MSYAGFVTLNLGSCRKRFAIIREHSFSSSCVGGSPDLFHRSAWQCGCFAVAGDTWCKAQPQPTDYQNTVPKAQQIISTNNASAPPAFSVWACPVHLTHLTHANHLQRYSHGSNGRMSKQSSSTCSCQSPKPKTESLIWAVWRALQRFAGQKPHLLRHCPKDRQPCHQPLKALPRQPQGMHV